MTRVTHLINGLGKGGAETMLYQVMAYRNKRDVFYHVISLGQSSFYENKILETGVKLTVLDIKRKPLTTVITLIKLLKDTDVLCTWMYHSNYIGYIFNIK